MGDWASPSVPSSRATPSPRLAGWRCRAVAWHGLGLALLGGLGGALLTNRSLAFVTDQRVIKRCGSGDLSFYGFICPSLISPFVFPYLIPLQYCNQWFGVSLYLRGFRHGFIECNAGAWAWA